MLKLRRRSRKRTDASFAATFGAIYSYRMLLSHTANDSFELGSGFDCGITLATRSITNQRRMCKGVMLGVQEW